MYDLVSDQYLHMCYANAFTIELLHTHCIDWCIVQRYSNPTSSVTMSCGNCTLALLVVAVVLRVISLHSTFFAAHQSNITSTTVQVCRVCAGQQGAGRGVLPA
jgi:hypothetical protein